MVAISFSAQMAPLVAGGLKFQTVRRKARCKPGDRLQLYTGMRTKACRKLVVPDPVCVSVEDCVIRPEWIIVGKRKLLREKADEFAEADGFRCHDEMFDWFHDMYELEEFVGVVIKWKLFEGTE